MVLVCDVLEPTTGEPYNRDPRGIAKKAEAMVKSMGIGDGKIFVSNIEEAIRIRTGESGIDAI